MDRKDHGFLCETVNVYILWRTGPLGVSHYIAPFKSCTVFEHSAMPLLCPRFRGLLNSYVPVLSILQDTDYSIPSEPFYVQNGLYQRKVNSLPLLKELDVVCKQQNIQSLVHIVHIEELD